MWLNQSILQAKKELRILEDQTREFNKLYRFTWYRLPQDLEQEYFSIIDRKAALRLWVERAMIMSQSPGSSSKIKFSVWGLLYHLLRGGPFFGPRLV